MDGLKIGIIKKILCIRSEEIGDEYYEEITRQTKIWNAVLKQDNRKKFL